MCPWDFVFHHAIKYSVLWYLLAGKRVSPQAAAGRATEWWRDFLGYSNKAGSCSHACRVAASTPTYTKQPHLFVVCSNCCIQSFAKMLRCSDTNTPHAFSRLLEFCKMGCTFIQGFCGCVWFEHIWWCLLAVMRQNWEVLWGCGTFLVGDVR